MADKKPKKSKKTDPDAITRKDPAPTVKVHFGDAAPGACKIAGANLVLAPGDNDLAPATVELLRSHPIGERCRVDGKRLREPKPDKD